MPAQAVTVTITLESIFDITIAAVVGGTADITTDINPAAAGETVTINIANIQAGRRFVSIAVVGENSDVISTSQITEGAQYTFTMPAQAVTVTITLESIFDITVAGVVGGTAEVAPGVSSAAQGEVVIINISNVEIGKRFSTIEVKKADNTSITVTQIVNREKYSFIMPEEDVTVTVTLESVDYNVTAYVSPEGASTITGAGGYNFNDNVSLVASPNPGYSFINWTNEAEEIVSTHETYVFTMPAANVTLTANFEILDFIVTTVSSPEEGGSTTGDGIFNVGNNITITAVANTGYQFINWTNETNTILSTEATYVFEMPAINITYTANFDPINYNVVAFVNPENAGTINGAGSYNINDAVSVEAIAAQGFQFINWTDSENIVLSTETVYAFSMPAENVALNANFQAVVSASINPISGTVYDSELVDLETIITWNDANSVQSILALNEGENTPLILNEDYTIEDIDGTTAKLTFLTSNEGFGINDLKSESNIVCTINFDNGEASAYTITYVITDMYLVSFNVQDQNATSISDAIITFNGIELNQGVYEVGYVEAGEYNYSVEKTGYITATGTINVVDQDVETNVILTLPPTYEATFHITSAGSAISEASIIIEEQQTIVTDINGNATIALENGTYSFTITKSGYQPLTGEFTVAGEDKLIEIELMVGINEQTLTNLKIYPNPVVDILHIERTETTPVSVEIYTENGTLIKRMPWDSDLFEMNVSNYKTGFFVVRIKSVKNVKTLQFIKK